MGIVNLETMNGYVEEGSLFDTKGRVDEEPGGKFYVIEDELAKSNLKGQFIASNGGKVYYYEDGLNVGGNDGNIDEDPEYTDNDFEWVADSNGYNATGQSGRGYFKYVGTGQKTIEIPHIIEGNEMTSYYRMFYQTGEDVEKVISTNDNVVNMRQMFHSSQATTLDLSSFDTSKVTDMSSMFYYSQATKGYAGTQADANRFNASSSKPSGLTFTVKE